MALLDSAMLMNLQRREDRYWFAYGALRSLEWDHSRIIRFISHDAEDYPDAESIQDAAVADGFPYFAEMSGLSKEYTAWYWTWRCALRHIIEIDQTVLLLIDDCQIIPGWTFWRLYHLVAESIGTDHGFRIIQLAKCYDSPVPINPKPYSSMLAKGGVGEMDLGTLINPEGAKLLLDLASREPYGSPPQDFGKLVKLENDPAIFKGIWHTLDDICIHGFVPDDNSGD